MRRRKRTPAGVTRWTRCEKRWERLSKWGGGSGEWRPEYVMTSPNRKCRFSCVRQPQAGANRLANGFTVRDGVLGHVVCGCVAWVPVADGIAAQINENLAKCLPEGLVRQIQVQQFFQVVNSWKRHTCFHEPSLEVFLDTLLGVETNRVVVRLILNAQLPHGGGEVSLGFINPLLRDGFHRGSPPVRESRR